MKKLHLKLTSIITSLCLLAMIIPTNTYASSTYAPSDERYTTQTNYSEETKEDFQTVVFDNQTNEVTTIDYHETENEIKVDVYINGTLKQTAILNKLTQEIIEERDGMIRKHHVSDFSKQIESSHSLVTPMAFPDYKLLLSKNYPVNSVSATLYGYETATQGEVIESLFSKGTAVSIAAAVLGFIYAPSFFSAALAVGAIIVSGLFDDSFLVSHFTLSTYQNYQYIINDYYYNRTVTRYYTNVMRHYSITNKKTGINQWVLDEGTYYPREQLLDDKVWEYLITR